MEFGGHSLDLFLPNYLTDTNKNRLKSALEQFVDPDSKSKTIDYTDFYLETPPSFLMQGDLLNSIPVYDWDYERNNYTTGFAPVIIASNSCDVYSKEEGLLEKEGLFACVIPFDEFEKDLKDNGFSAENIVSIRNNLTHQTYTNIFYMPPTFIDKREYLVFFDKTFWHPSEKLREYASDISSLRFISLGNFGFYLFILKLSFHFCRVPEESERDNT